MITVLCEPQCCPDYYQVKRFNPKLLAQGGLTLKFPLPYPGQSFHSRVLENCEDVADFDEVGLPQGQLEPRAQRGTSTSLPPGGALAPNPGRTVCSRLLMAGLLPGREPPFPLHPDLYPALLHKRAPCRAVDIESGPVQAQPQPAASRGLYPLWRKGPPVLKAS